MENNRIKKSYCERCKKRTEDIVCGFEGVNQRTECVICRTVKVLDWRNRFFR